MAVDSEDNARYDSVTFELLIEADVQTFEIQSVYNEDGMLPTAKITKFTAFIPDGSFQASQTFTFQWSVSQGGATVSLPSGSDTAQVLSIAKNTLTVGPEALVSVSVIRSDGVTTAQTFTYETENNALKEAGVVLLLPYQEGVSGDKFYFEV